ncbi:hypothetical protein FHT15_003725 [Xanthomonas campestris]
MPPPSPRGGFTACPASGEGAAPSTLLAGCTALARPPSRDTPQVRPCRLRRGIHAAQGPATVGGQGPVERVGVHGKSSAGCASFNHEASAPRPMHTARQTAFQMSIDQLSGAVSLPVAGPCGGMDAATEPPGTGLRRAPRAMRAPRPRRCGFAAGPLPAHHRGTRRKYVLVGSYAASMPRKVPRRWAGKDQSRWSVRMVASRGRQCMQRSRPMRCGLIRLFLSEQSHCQYDITPHANESEGGRRVAAIAAAFERFCWPLQVAARPGQQAQHHAHVM